MQKNVLYKRTAREHISYMYTGLLEVLRLTISGFVLYFLGCKQQKMGADLLVENT